MYHHTILYSPFVLMTLSLSREFGPPSSVIQNPAREMASRPQRFSALSSSASQASFLSRTRAGRRYTAPLAVSSPPTSSWSSQSASSKPCLPVIDVSALVAHEDEEDTSVSRETYLDVCAQLDAACRDTGFFYVRGHNVDEQLVNGELLP